MLMASVVVAATSPCARSMCASCSTAARVASPIRVSQPSAAYRCNFASLVSTTTNGSGLRASSRAALRPTRPAPQMMKWPDSRLISRSMRLLPNTGDSGEHHVKPIEKRPALDEVKSQHADDHQSDQCHEQHCQIERDLHVSHSAR